MRTLKESTSLRKSSSRRVLNLRQIMNFSNEQLASFMRWLAFYMVCLMGLSVWFKTPDVAIKTLEYLIAGLAGAIFAWTRGGADKT